MPRRQKKTIRRRSARSNTIKNARNAKKQKGGTHEPYCKFVFTGDFVAQDPKFKEEKVALCYSQKNEKDCNKASDPDVNQILQQAGYTEEQGNKICNWTTTDYDNQYANIFNNIIAKEKTPVSMNNKSLIPRATPGNLSGKCVNKSVL